MTVKKLHFISYSRREYYFTESLVLHLQRIGLNVWFDNQQITPGTNWQTDIQEGLEQSTDLVLVASKASISSPYVQREWEYALQANKSIYVLIFESVTLPPSLSKLASIIDCRTNFERGISELIECLQRGATRYDEIYNLGPWWLLRSLPRGVRWVQIQLFYNLALWLLLAYFFFFPGVGLFRQSYSGAAGTFNDLCVIPFVLLAAGMCLRITYLWQRFPQRVFAPKTLSRTLIWMLALQVMGIVRFLVGGNPLSLVSAVIILTFPFTVFLYLKCRRHPDLLRWCALGDVQGGWRVEVNQRLLTALARIGPRPAAARYDSKAANEQPFLTSTPADESTKTYRMFYAPGDEAIVREISKTILDIGFYPQVDTEVVDYNILILNPWTSKVLIAQVGQSRGTLICVLASSIKKPDELPDLTASQWIDYRERSPNTLKSAFLYLRDSSVSYRAALSLNTQPAQLGGFAFPKDLEDLYRVLRRIGAWSIAGGFVGLRWLWFQQGAMLPLSLLHILVILNGVYLFRVAWTIAGVRKQKKGSLLAAGLLPLALLGVSIFLTMFLDVVQGAMLPEGELSRRIVSSIPGFVILIWLGISLVNIVDDVNRRQFLNNDDGVILGAPPIPVSKKRALQATVAGLGLYLAALGIGVLITMPVCTFALAVAIVPIYANRTSPIVKNVWAAYPWK